MGPFADYAHQLVPFASGWLLTVIVWAATATEATLGVLLLTGWRPQLVGAATCLVLISAAAAYAVLGTTSPPHTTASTHLWLVIQSRHSKPSQADSR
jgi:hypothetical protein